MAIERRSMKPQAFRDLIMSTIVQREKTAIKVTIVKITRSMKTSALFVETWLS